MPAVRPVTLQVREALVHVSAPGELVTVYSEIAEPFAVAAVQVTAA